MIPALSPGAAAPAAAPARASTSGRMPFSAVLERASAPPAPHPGGRGSELPPPALAARSSPSSPVRLLEAVDRARARLDAVLAAARSGRTFTAQELLGLQAEAYRTAQTIDLAAKLAEQGAQAVRQALATQV